MVYKQLVRTLQRLQLLDKRSALSKFLEGSLVESKREERVGVSIDHCTSESLMRDLPGHRHTMQLCHTCPTMHGEEGRVSKFTYAIVHEAT